MQALQNWAVVEDLSCVTGVLVKKATVERCFVDICVYEQGMAAMLWLSLSW